ncbi:DEAD/DEAH box helicase, partial [Candidatus Saccharibacteria bacterium]|nr:DEAD/DEAH box helicase [Candidatus Saccharibacteria bacterium]
MKFALTTPLTKLTGVGEVIGRKLALMGLSTVHDLLHYYPRRYDDFSSVAPIAQLRPGLVSVRARVEHISQRRSFKRRGMTLTEVIVVDETGSLKLTWFNSPFIINSLKEGKEYFFVGELKFTSQSFGIIQPNFESVDHPQMAGHIIPVYPETSSISSKLIRQLISQCLDVSATLTDPLPEPVRKGHNLLTRAEAMRIIHRPESQAQLHEARASMAFSEVFCFILTGLILQREIETEPALQIAFNQTLAEQFVDSLSFQLTDSQRKVSWQILQDMASAKPMNRLLEGDVGSGKTIVAAFASLMTIRAGYQVAIMVPTEVLATQHLHSFTAILQPWGITPRLLTSSLPVVEKRALRNAVADGSVEIVIGTQALLTTQTHFAELGLVVVDEQHRFGVNQRLALKDKAGRLPHVLTMTAT